MAPLSERYETAVLPGTLRLRPTDFVRQLAGMRATGAGGAFPAASHGVGEQPGGWSPDRSVAGGDRGRLLIAGRKGGLNWLVVGAVLALLAGTANAWVLLVEIVRDERYQPVGQEQAP